MDFAQHLQSYVERINTNLHNFIEFKSFQNNSSSIVRAMKYGTLLGGKRLRSFLVYATGNMFGICNDTLDVPAAAIEFIHAYSIMHDDLPIMDNDNLRRGLPSCHVKYGEANAILAGNALQTLAFSILSDSPMIGVSDRNRLVMVSELAMASGVNGMCSGQSLDLESEGQQITLEQLERIYLYKTGALIIAAVRLGALSAGDRCYNVLPILNNYAKYIGLAFQVQDDILDVIGDTKIIGKKQGADQKLNKNTYPALLGIEQSKLKAKELVNYAHQALDCLDNNLFDISILKNLANYIIQRDR